MKYKIIFGLSIFMIFSSFELLAQPQSQPQFFTFAHENCEAQLNLETEGFNESDQELMASKIKEAAEKKGFDMSASERESFRVASDQLYFEAKMRREGLIYKSCIIDLKLKKPEEQRFGSNNNETLYEGKVNRQFPRVTFKGNERCTRAINDVFVNIATCIKR